MQDGDAELAVGVDVGVEGDGLLEGHRGRAERVVAGEVEVGSKIAPCFL